MSRPEIALRSDVDWLLTLCPRGLDMDVSRGAINRAQTIPLTFIKGPFLWQSSILRREGPGGGSSMHSGTPEKDPGRMALLSRDGHVRSACHRWGILPRFSLVGP
jgi:hypothetical protein